MDKKTFIVSSLKSGALMAATFIVFSMITYILEVNPFNISFSIISLLVTVLIISVFQTMGGKTYRNVHLKGEMTYGQAFVFLISIGVFASLIVGLYDLIYSYTADLSYLEPKLNEFIENLESKGNIPEEQLNKIIEKTEKAINMPGYKRAYTSVISNVVFNAVIALIVAIFVKKEKEISVEDEF
jgi:hypothetical protein